MGIAIANLIDAIDNDTGIGTIVNMTITTRVGQGHETTFILNEKALTQNLGHVVVSSSDGVNQYGVNAALVRFLLLAGTLRGMTGVAEHLRGD